MEFNFVTRIQVLLILFLPGYAFLWASRLTMRIGPHNAQRDGPTPISVQEAVFFSILCDVGIYIGLRFIGKLVGGTDQPAQFFAWLLLTPLSATKATHNLIGPTSDAWRELLATLVFPAAFGAILGLVPDAWRRATVEDNWIVKQWRAVRGHRSESHGPPPSS